ncbi:MAG: aspartate carbamoyltransferase [Verrucomicrobia bacterium]|nr:aspartate carbamoyltransferase [Verrucomicrobiota bacterium]
MSLSGLPWEAYQALDADARAHHLMASGRPEHVLMAQQFRRAELDAICALATEIRLLAKSQPGALYLSQVLAHKRAMLYFTQPSTRTFLSHQAACQILGLQTGEVRDTATSSEMKGESREDSVRTFSSYFDLIIMRTKERGLAERMAWVLSQSERPVPIINAGSGQDQHPTQALLDIYTLQRSFETCGGIDGKHIAFVGDLARGRTVRSLAALLANYRDVSISFIAPEAFQIGTDVLTLLRACGVTVSVSDNLQAILPVADGVYMTRVQDEWDAEAGDSARVDVSRFHLRPADVDKMKPTAVIMHPLPRREEVPPEIDHDPRAMYWRQMRNGMWVRAALIAQIFGVDEAICAHIRDQAHGA